MTALADPDHTLRQIVETADLFNAGGGTWLLAPAPPELVDTLAALGAVDEDREPDDPPEVNGDDEHDLRAHPTARVERGIP